MELRVRAKPSLSSRYPGTETVACPSLKKATPYFLSEEFGEQIGIEVSLVKFIRAANVFPGTRGTAAVVRNSDGHDFYVKPDGFLFSDRPKDD